jgi:tRNA(fMet)-specific endonuclease VapC
MAGLSYLLDTNAIADYINNVTSVRERIYAARQNQDHFYLCQPVYYEVLRGLLRTNANRKLTIFEGEFRPLLLWLPLVDADWRQAAQNWADTSKAGKQLSEVDLLIAALAIRLEVVIISAGNDFDALRVKRENWRVT